MKKSYRQRLFRLFLLSSIIPAFIVLLSGYFLFIEYDESSFELADNRLDIVRHLTKRKFDNIREALKSYKQIQQKVDNLEFLFHIKEGKIFSAQDFLSLDPLTAEKVKEAGLSKEQGMIEHNDALLQFVRETDSSGNFTIGGLIHSKEEVALYEAFGNQIALEKSSEKLKPKLILFITLIFIIILGISLLGAYYVSKKFSYSLSDPLIRMIDATSKIANGDFNQQIRTNQDQEFNELIESFNKMSAQLSQLTMKLTQTERVAAWRHTARQFAHELKNPIQPILVSLYRIEKLLIDSPEYDKIYEPLKAASEEVKHLEQLANRFSHLSKLPEPNFETINLQEMINTFLEMYHLQTKNRKIILTFPDTPILINSDRSYLREILHNLIINAIDATGEKDKIEIRIAIINGFCKIIVIDSGKGMNADTLTKARLPYVTDKESGTGLGLSIVEKICEELKGELLIESTEGKGTIVTISIPTRE